MPVNKAATRLALLINALVASRRYTPISGQRNAQMTDSQHDLSYTLVALKDCQNAKVSHRVVVINVQLINLRKICSALSH